MNPHLLEARYSVAKIPHRALPSNEGFSQLSGGVMADREVTGMRRRSDGRPVAVCHHGEDWSPRSAVDVIHDIETGAHAYHVNWV